MSFLVRPYISTDYDSILAVWQATGLGGAHRGDNREVIERTLAHGGAFYVLQNNDDSQIIGTAWITSDARRLYLHHFGIIPEYQGQKLSHLLMKQCMEYTRQQQLQIKLEVHQNNLIAQHLYENYGFGYLGDYKVLIVREV